MRARRKLTYLNKLVLYGCVLGIVPLLTLGIFSYIRASNTIQKYVEESHLQILKQNEFRVEQNLKIVETTITSFLSSSFVSNSLLLPLENKYYDEFTQLAGSFRQLQVFELGVTEVGFYNLEQKWLITNHGISAFDEKTANEDVALYLNIKKDSSWIYDSNGVKLVKKNPVFVPSPSIIAIAGIPLSHLRSLLLSDSKLGSTFLLNEDLLPLASQNEPFTNDLLQSQEAITAISDKKQKSGHFEMEYNNQTLGVTFIRSPLNGWVYVAAVSIDDITRESKAIGQFTLWICLIIVLFIVVGTLFGSRQMYGPIRRLHAAVVGQADKAGKIGHGIDDELLQIRQRFLSLLDTQQTMTTQLQGQQGQLKEFFVRRLFLGEVQSREIREQIQRFGFNDSWKQFTVVTVEIDSLDQTHYQQRDRDLLLFAISNMAGELASPDIRLDPIVLHQGQSTVIGASGGDREQVKQLAYRFAEHIQQAASSYLGLTVSVGISRDYHELSDVPKAYQESLEALKYRVRLGNAAIIFIDEVINQTVAEASYPGKLAEELMKAVKSSDLEMANVLLPQFMQELVKEPFHFQEYQFSLIRFLSELGSLLQDQGIPLRTLATADEALFDHLLKLRTVDEIEVWLKQAVINPVLIMLEEKRNSQFQNISDEVIRMIHEGFDMDLTLEACASRIDYHPHYVSKVFRQETGVNFSDYLLQHRLVMAKKWLVHTDMKISDIADKLKYASAGNFIRYFRKIEGMTPGQYREQMLASWNGEYEEEEVK
ncbi:AraC-type DNA-binding protein [Paenibacillus sp. 1_12]|uniref:helix-turn-helix domain-containing protein n=1 Tax=Paenibacillus sp. 1_12 TaxID=1566278 RepID=UPI0008EDC0E6|nr:helix-turn-helix domain-containing protein [Paenibacillus sp. 1_12]SFL58409.1 AraC-type DNA-binding protein [Paenibacillus sp. 1_12]